MLMYAFYHYWRYEQGMGSFVLYILAAMLYSTYACAWVRAALVFVFGPSLNITQDYMADWSVLNVRAKYPLLRDEVLCPDHLPVSAYLKGST